MTDDDQEDTQLPLTQTDTFLSVQPSFDKLPEDADITEVRKADVKIFNFQLDTLSTAYSNVRSLGALIALNREVRDMIKTRRDILGLEYGAPSNKAPRTFVLEPIP